MNKLLTAILAGALALGAADLQAKTLEEILKEKGIITEEDYKEATQKNGLATYQPGKGITVESRDGNYKAHVGGRLQARYTFTDEDLGQDSSSFTIRRMKLWLQGHVFTPKLTYKYQQNLNDTEDAYAAYRFIDAFGLQLGQAKAPQGRQELTSSGSQLFVDRSLANDTFNLGRDIGLTAEGEFAGHIVEYMVGVYNGNGPNQGNPNNQHMVAGRIDVNPLGRFKMDEAGWPEEQPLLNLGASYALQAVGTADDGSGFNRDNDLLDVALDLDNNPLTGDTDVEVWTLNLHAKWMGATFGAEYYRMNAEPDAGDDWDADGYYVQAGYQVMPKTLELAARYSAIDSTDGNAIEQFEKSEAQFGVNYYLAKHNAKLQADYTAVSDDHADNNDDNIFRLQAQVIF